MKRPRFSALLATLVVALTLASCTTVARPPEFVERVGRIEQARLERHVQSLHTIGPRPIEDREATRRTTSWLRAELEDLGYTVSEELVTRNVMVGRNVARVRRPDAGPDGEVTLIDLPAGFLSYGPRVIESQSRRLRADGWEVLGYALQEIRSPEEPITAPNLFAELPGASQPGRVIEVSAHYDTVPACPGAADNSSGVAALLEMARVLADARPVKTIRFCFFAAEEAGLAGSAVHIERLSRPGEAIVEALVNLDSVGLTTKERGTQRAPIRIPLVTWMPSRGNFVAVIGTRSSGWLGNLFEASAKAYVPELRYYSANRIGSWFSDGHRSDHAHYWKAGIPAVFLTDTGDFRSDTYHRPDDTPDKLDYAFLLRVTRAATATVLELTLR